MHNYSPYGAYFTKSNLDFSNIKSFNYSYVLSTSNSSYQVVRLNDSSNYYLNISLSSTGTVELNGATGLTFDWIVANNNNGTFKVTSYTTMDDVVHNL